MKRMLKLFAGMLSAVIIILSIPVSHADAATPQVINIILGETTTTVKTEQSQYRVYTAPYGLDAGYVDPGETIKVYFKEYSAGTMYYYIEFQGSYGRKRAYIPASSINEVNVITRSFTTTANCYAKTTIPIKNGNTQWFHQQYDHTLNKGDLVTVLAQVGRWFMVEHYHNGRNIRGFVDFARIDYYKINEHYRRNTIPRMNNIIGCVYYGMELTDFGYKRLSSLLPAQCDLWNDCDGNEDHIGQNWKFHPYTVDDTLQQKTTVYLQLVSHLKGSDGKEIRGQAGTMYLGGKLVYGIRLHKEMVEQNTDDVINRTLNHEMGHILGLGHMRNSDNVASVMTVDDNYKYKQRQYADVVGVWDFYNGYQNGYSRN